MREFCYGERLQFYLYCDSLIVLEDTSLHGWHGQVHRIRRVFGGKCCVGKVQRFLKI